MTDQGRRHTLIMAASGLTAMTASMILMSIVQPGDCPVADVMGSHVPPGCQSSALLYELHLTAGLLIGVLAAYAADRVLRARQRKRDRT